MSLWAELLLWTSLIASALAVGRRSWSAMAAAAVLSMLLSVAALFSIGLLLALLPSLQLAAAVAFRWRLAPAGWAGVLLLALIAWGIGGPGYLATGGFLPAFLVLAAWWCVALALLAWDRPPRWRSAA